MTDRMNFDIMQMILRSDEGKSSGRESASSEPELVKAGGSASANMAPELPA